MKIAISASGETLEDSLDKRFGRCPYFIIQDSETGDVEVIENEGIKSAGGAGITAAQQMIDNGVDIIITGNLGPNAFKLVDRAGIVAYKCGEIIIRDALEQFSDGELVEINKSGPAYHGGQ